MILLFLALLLGAVKISWIVNVADFLLGVMSLFCVAPAVAIISIWADVSDIWPVLVILLIVTYLVSMLLTGVTAQTLIEKFDQKSKPKERK